MSYVAQMLKLSVTASRNLANHQLPVALDCGIKYTEYKTSLNDGFLF